MAQIKSLKELADLGFVIAFRFYGRYPETGPSFYHPPPCESDRAQCAVEASTALSAAKNVDRGGHSPVLRPATSLILPSTLSASSLLKWNSAEF